MPPLCAPLTAAAVEDAAAGLWHDARALDRLDRLDRLEHLGHRAVAWAVAAAAAVLAHGFIAGWLG